MSNDTRVVIHQPPQLKIMMSAAPPANAAAPVRRTHPAGLPLSAWRAVIVQPDGSLRYPDLSAPGDGALICGLSMNAAQTGGDVAVNLLGLAVDVDWTWQAGPIFAGDQGVLVQARPAGAWVRQIGVALSSTRIEVRLGPAILTPQGD